MTETEARKFIKRFERLCSEYERDCGCEFHLKLSEQRKGINKLKWITIEGLSIKIDS